VIAYTLGATSCKNDLSLIVHEKEIIKSQNNRVLQVYYPEFESRNANSRKACNFINADIKNFVDNLMTEINCDSEYQGNSKSIDFNKELKVDYDLAIFDKDCISTKFTIYSYQGGAHGLTYYKCFIYDVNKAKQLFLGDLLHVKQKKEVKSLNRLLVKYFENPNQCFNELPEINSDFDCFSYQDDSFIFSFSDYTLGAYVCGTAEIRVPIWDLKQHGLLKF